MNDKKLKKLIAKPMPDMWERLADVEEECLIVRPPNSFTCKEYAAKRGIRFRQACTILERLHRIGKIEKIKPPNSSQVFWTLK